MLPLTPKPQKARELGYEVVLPHTVAIAADESFAAVAEGFRARLAEATGWELPLHDADAGSNGVVTIRFVSAPDKLETLGVEGYRLTIDGSGARIEAATDAGAFYGAQSLRLLLPPATLGVAMAEPPSELSLPACEIEDKPRFSWRAQHIDVARRFLPLPWLKRLVDLIALHKLNVLHLHLTDDQGWRVEIEKYPRLTEVGAWRRETMTGFLDDGPGYDGERHGGFYTKDDLRQLVAYAAERFVTVVPEIDLPGHMQAAIAAYPELGNGGEPVEVMTAWGISPHVLNVEESTIGFCCDVLDEVLEVFPARHVHIGGDECPKEQWKASSRAQELMRERGLATEEELQSWFMREVAQHLESRDRTVLFWDEILEGGAPETAVVMSWRGEEAGIEAARSGHDVIMAPYRFVYFDAYQAADPREPVANYPELVIDLETVHGYNPVPAGLAPGDAARVLGSQAHLWTEYIPTVEHAEYMLFPRVCAFAEVVWSAPEGEFSEFLGRLHAHVERLDVLGVAYRPLGEPALEPSWISAEAT